MRVPWIFVRRCRMDAFLKTLQTLPEVAELVSRVENGGCPAVLTGGGSGRGKAPYGISLRR